VTLAGFALCGAGVAVVLATEGRRRVSSSAHPARPAPTVVN
jgi:hypothetical protein